MCMCVNFTRLFRNNPLQFFRFFGWSELDLKSWLTRDVYSCTPSHAIELEGPRQTIKREGERQLFARTYVIKVIGNKLQNVWNSYLHFNISTQYTAVFKMYCHLYGDFISNSETVFHTFSIPYAELSINWSKK